MQISFHNLPVVFLDWIKLVPTSFLELYMKKAYKDLNTLNLLEVVLSEIKRLKAIVQLLTR